MANDQPDWGVTAITAMVTGSGGPASGVTNLVVLGGAIPYRRFFSATFTADTAGLVVVGTYVGPPVALTNSYFTFYAVPGHPVPFEFGPEGWLSASAGQVQWAFTHSVAGANIAYMWRMAT